MQVHQPYDKRSQNGKKHTQTHYLDYHTVPLSVGVKIHKRNIVFVIGIFRVQFNAPQSPLGVGDCNFTVIRFRDTFHVSYPRSRQP